MRTENSEQRGMPGLQSQVTEPLESVRDVRNSARGVPSLETITEVDSLHMGTRAAHDEGFGSIYRELPLSNPVSPQQLRVSTSTESKFEFRNLSKAITSLKGTPKRLFFPVTKEHLRKMMHLRNLTAAQERAVIITSTRSQLCCRVSEVRNFQVCDFLKDQAMAFSSRCRGCAAFQIRKQKQDTRRRDLYPECFVEQLQRCARFDG